MNTLFYNLFIHSVKNPVIRLNPSLLMVNSTHNYFKSVKDIYNTTYKNGLQGSIEVMHYTYLNPKENTKSPDLYEARFKKLYLNILDISWLEYDFKSYELPMYYDTHIKYISGNKIDSFYKELIEMKKKFNIESEIDGYKIGENVYLMFDDKNEIIVKQDTFSPYDIGGERVTGPWS
jgi:hypothetical protein